jgi:drug/metabolite transporter (DMT)-like permease
MDAVALALTSAFLFGGMTIALRFALRGERDADLGALVTVLSGFCVIAVAAVATGADLDLRGTLLFAVAGAMAPGISQLFFTFAIREAGASRTSAITGTSPLFAVAIAFLIRGEPFSTPLFVGALLIVAGGALLVLEPDRPAHFRLLGIGLAAAGAVVFAVRDNYIRALADDTEVDAFAAAAVAQLAGVVVALAYLLVVRRGRIPRPRGTVAFVPAGVLFGLSYLCLFEAYYRGRVSVVSPLVATESLWGVVLSALVLRQSELVGKTLAVGAVLIVAGGALIGVFR